MIKRIIILTTTCIFILLNSCQTSNEKRTTYFGGKISNPKGEFVFLKKGNVVIDSAKIDHNHNFNFMLDSISSGLYSFAHGPELQFIFLELKDSLMLRLNTWDFDESLVFNGRGAERNNFLIHLFLENERSEKSCRDFYEFDEDMFVNKTDSIISHKLNQFKQFEQGTVQQSIAFENLIHKAIYYPIYSKKENYAYYHKKYKHLDKLPKLSKSFYNYRKSVSLNDSLFVHYFSYINYLKSFIYNNAVNEKEKNENMPFSTILLNEISENIKFPKLKNQFLQSAYFESLLDQSLNEKEQEIAYRIFKNNCTDNKIISKYDELIESNKQFIVGRQLPDIQLKTLNDKLTNLQKIAINKHTVIYFWPKELSRIQNMAKRVNYLIKRHPEITFVGIDGQLDNYNWKSYTASTPLLKNNQYQMVNTTNQLWYSNDYPKTIISNKRGVIINNFTFLSHGNFEEELIKLEKSKSDFLIVKK
jgi:hypothetical protein